MNGLEALEKYNPTDSFYALDDKLFIHILRRSDKAFDRADKLRDAVRTREQFEEYRRNAIEVFAKSVGEIPYDKSLPLNAGVTKSFTDNGLRIENIVFQSRKNVYVTANLYKPENAEGKLPTVLFQCGHASGGKMHPQYQRVCRIIARSGIAVLIIDHIGQGERNAYPELYPKIDSPCYEHERVGLQCIMADSSVLKYFVSDAMRAIDYIESRDDLDSDRIGATGNSGGGTMTAVTAVLDGRIKAVATGTFLTTRREYFNSGSTQDAEQVWEGVTKNNFDHHELISAVCPKPYLILGVRSDFFCPEGTVSLFEKERELYSLFGCEDKLKIEWDDSTHCYTPRLAMRAAEFFNETLADRIVSAEDDEASCEASQLYATKTGNTFTEYPSSPIVFDENLKDFSEKEVPENAVDILRDKIYFERTEAFPMTRHLAKRELDGMTAEHIMWFTQKDIPCYGVLFSSDECEEKSPVAVCLWSGGTNTLSEKEEVIRRFLKGGKRVLVTDLTSMGKCAPRNILYNIGSFDTLVRLSKELLFLGDSLPAMMAYDLIKTIDAVKNTLDSGSVLIYTEGKYSIIAQMLEKIGTDAEFEYHKPVTAGDILSDKLYSFEDINRVAMTGIGVLLKERK